jgi:hypothetical protein
MLGKLDKWRDRLNLNAVDTVALHRLLERSRVRDR